MVGCVAPLHHYAITETFYIVQYNSLSQIKAALKNRAAVQRNGTQTWM